MPALKPKEIEYAKEFFDLTRINLNDISELKTKASIRENFINAIDDDAKRVVLKQYVEDYILPRWVKEQSKINAMKTAKDAEVSLAQTYIS